MLRVYSILRVYSEYRVLFVLRVLRVLKSTGGLNTRSTWSMSGTGDPYTASTGSISSTYARVQAVPAVQTSKARGVLRVSRVLNPEILHAFE